MTGSLLLHFSGRDQPGISAAITGILSAHNVCILDIGQAVVHEVLALGILIELPNEAELDRMRTELIKRSQQLGLHVDFTSVPGESHEHWTLSQGREQFIITVLGRSISAHHLAHVCNVLVEQGLNIDRIDRLSTPLSLAAHHTRSNACIEFRVSGQTKAEEVMRARLAAITADHNIDIAFQRETLFRRNRRLFAFDMDSTLIQGEVIDELARLAGVSDKVVAITSAAMRGEIEFKESFRRRVALLKGLPEADVLSLLGKIPLVEGAEQLVRTLKLLGYKTAILSGGFTFFGRYLQQHLGIDYLHANELRIAQGKVTGDVSDEIIDGPAKAALLQKIVAKENLSLEQVVAVGDGANDLPMLKIAGMGIAFHAKPLVRAGASHALSHLGLDSLLYLIGVRDEDLASGADV